ncbi:MAG: DNA polymerase III subunit alpha [Maricaulis sp.]|uniref:DNA polymerase III subunit alpha n=1 Tax=Maricaulis sp. TaxID=1486257 RepID=UPI00261B6AC3|nr:DNA polymerase III subunit alpha [Maricaulis sp.]MDM7982837.1 DNA polymerase III subunit alpha [Maricaulis sp.]
MDTKLPFVHLRVRSPYSLLEGAIRIPKMVDACQAYGMPAIALTDTNNLFGALEFSEKMAEAGIQPIVGITLSVRVSDPHPGERAEPDGTLALYAQNAEGYLNLMALTSAAFLDVDGAEEPQVALDNVLEHSAGLIALTGGPDSVLNQYVVAGRESEASDLLARYQAAFGDRLYVELQRHGRAEELTAEDWLIDQAYARDLPLVATNEAFFPDQGMHRAHDALLCISGSTYVSVEDRRKVTADHHLATPDEMRERFKDLPEALENTLEVARRCAYRVRTHPPILPSFETAEGRDEAEELVARAHQGLTDRIAAGQANSLPESEYRERLDFELNIIKQMGFPGYFLIVSDFIQWSKGNDIPVGPGRGSGAGSLVAYALTITDLDPLRFGLLFERFLNPERVSMPDFDVDFCQERRGEVIRYVQDKYGHDRVAQIITFGTLQARAVVRDVGRVLQLPFGLVDKLAKLIPANPANPVTLAQALDIEPRLKEMRAEDQAVDSLLEVALKLEGFYRNASTHAAGVVIGDRKLSELVPLYRDPRSDIPATQFNMKWVEPAGLVKFDFLGLKTLTVIARALDYIASAGKEVPDIEAVSLEDRPTYELLASGNAIGVFQLESSGMRDTLKKMKPDAIEDLIALISLYRPGPMKNIDVYVDRKFGRAEVDCLHPDLEGVLSETYGVIIYQEQVMQIAQILSGYSLGEADLLRRAMGKKKKEEMDKQKVRFLDGAEEKGVDRAKSSYIFELVAEFAGYGFNKSHAAAYAVIAYRTAYLKANYPVELMAALMSLDAANTDKLAAFHQEIRRMGITVRPPDVNASNADFSVEEGCVRFALGAIRNVGFSAMEHIVAEREEKGPFKDLYDFAERIDPRQVNRRTFENLARAGAFDTMEPDRAKVIASAETLLSMAQHAAEQREGAQASLFGGGGGEVELQRPNLTEPEPFTAQQRLDEELSAIGFYLSGHPLDDLTEQLAGRGVVMFAESTGRVLEGATALRLCGVVRRRQERVSNKSGERFAWVTLSDPTGEFEVFVAPELLRTSRDQLESGSAVLVNCRVDNRDEQISFFADRLEVLDTRMAAHSLKIRLDDPAALAGIKARLDRANSRSDAQLDAAVDLFVPLQDGGEAEIRLAGRHCADASVQAALRAVRGVASIDAELA